MTTFPAGILARPLRLPRRADDPDGANLRTFAAVRNFIAEEVAGHADHAMSAEMLLPHLRDDPDEHHLMWLILDGDMPIGRAGIDLPMEPASRTASGYVELRRSEWGRGIGNAMAQMLETVVLRHDRRILQAWAEHREGPGPRLGARTGFGSVPAEDHVVRFLLRRGYTLEQIDRCSALELDGAWARIRRLRDEARVSAAGYRVVSWFPPTPPDHVDGYAWMKSRMVTDAPSGAMDYDDETWDAARVARHDSRYLEAAQTLHVTAAQHTRTGELCAFNELVVGPGGTGATFQEDTLVLAEHRGHRLGMLVKCEGLLSWRRIAPASPRVITYNAEENRPMLDINEAIGFVAISYEGAWQKRLAPPDGALPIS
ncbi:GNAT family N-acetyltransferase [Microbacterium sp. LRZ72]|uniref:GNAT family N-acetyltransferase n=1 Tax=Microbacterium sp. LRZ72 TaxID=2942481 RepID=UPI0029A2F01A|nr:GNAT family N-acetyltransferase [Microbacterium sp. LRZ72]MDX2375593.1 GNAT family N-acetyltransferase [Microbacterium sp. LRZ72]